MAAARDAPPAGAPFDAGSSLFFKLARLVNLTARPFHAAVGRAHRLSLNEWRVLVALAAQPGAAATQLADATGLDKMAVSRALGALQRHGRVERSADPRDQRRSVVQLSAQGRQLFQQIGLLARQREAELFAVLGPAELQALGATVDRLAAALQQRDAAR